MVDISYPVNPVDYNGTELMLSHRKLQEFCNTTMGNFNTLANEIQTMRLRASEIENINRRLIQFINWLAVTNPQILDEFQTTANAFEKLSPRDDGGETTAFAAP